MIVIVDYGMGNLRSVSKAIESIGYACKISSQPDEIANADKLILPGVGAFCDAIANLQSNDLVSPIRDFLSARKPFFGICLGLQMLFTRGFEDGEHRGLGIFEGDVIRFDLPRPLKVPHMGWNRLEITRPAPQLADLPGDPLVYFVHSYHVVPTDRSIVAAEADYGGRFVAAVHSENIFATQFHPEKSQRVGLKMLRNFAEL